MSSIEVMLLCIVVLLAFYGFVLMAVMFSIRDDIHAIFRKVKDLSTQSKSFAISISDAYQRLSEIEKQLADDAENMQEDVHGRR